MWPWLARHGAAHSRTHKHTNTPTHIQILSAFYLSLPVSSKWTSSLPCSTCTNLDIRGYDKCNKYTENLNRTTTSINQTFIQPGKAHWDLQSLLQEHVYTYPKHKLLQYVQQKIDFLRDQQHRCILFWGKLQYTHTGLLSQMLCDTSEPLFTAFDLSTLSDDKNFLFFTQLSATYSLCLHEVILSGFKHLTAVGVA